MIDIALICNYWHFEFEKKSSRYRTMADVLARQEEFQVEVITSSFRHQTKEQRNIAQINLMKFPYKIVLLNEPGYKKNITLKRIYSHDAFAKNIIKYLEKRKKPDIIICSVPSLSVGSAVTRYAKKNNIKVIVDVQDLWPEAFKIAINIPVVSDLLFLPMKKQANQIYRRADKIMAVSDTYVKRAMTINKKDTEGLSLYIGTDSELVNRAIEGIEINKPKNEFWIGYVGALGHSYDIRSIIDAIYLLKQKGIENVVFKIMGEGVLKEEFEKYAKQRKVKCDFMGFLEYGNMMSTLMECDIAVNPIVGESVASIINKVSDYAMAGVPVINTQNSKEYRSLIDEYQCGINCKNGDAESIASGIENMYLNEKVRKRMGKQAKILAREKFDRCMTYYKVVELIKDMVE